MYTTEILLKSFTTYNDFCSVLQTNKWHFMTLKIQSRKWFLRKYQHSFQLNNAGIEKGIICFYQ